MCLYSGDQVLVDEELVDVAKAVEDHVDDGQVLQEELEVYRRPIDVMYAFFLMH